jgi:hypothetical protein
MARLASGPVFMAGLDDRRHHAFAVFNLWSPSRPSDPRSFWAGLAAILHAAGYWGPAPEPRFFDI